MIIVKICAMSQKNGCKCDESRLYTLSHSDEDDVDNSKPSLLLSFAFFLLVLVYEASHLMPIFLAGPKYVNNCQMCDNLIYLNMSPLYANKIAIVMQTLGYGTICVKKRWIGQ